MILRRLLWTQIGLVVFSALACRNLIPLMHYDYTDHPNPWAGPIILMVWFGCIIVIPVLVLVALVEKYTPYWQWCGVALLEAALIIAVVTAMLPAVQ